MLGQPHSHTIVLLDAHTQFVLSVAHENLALARTAVAHALLIRWTEFIPVSRALENEIAVSDEGRIHRTCSKSSVTDSDD